jgi:hypothetical protein
MSFLIRFDGGKRPQNHEGEVYRDFPRKLFIQEESAVELPSGESASGG